MVQWVREGLPVLSTRGAALRTASGSDVTPLTNAPARR
jgi:hypothetical protein